MDPLYRVKVFFIALRGNHYTWPAIDILLSGNRHFHPIGSIHMGSRDTAPLPARLFKKPNHADALIVKADVPGDGTPSANLPIFVALEERISPERLENLCKITNELGTSSSLLSTQSLW